MKNNLRKVTTSLLLMLLLITISSLIGRSQDERGRNADASSTRAAGQNQPAPAKAQAPSRADEISAEEKLVRDVYARLMRYQSAAVDELSARSGKPSDTNDYLTFELRRIHSGPLKEISDRPLEKLVTPRGADLISLRPVYLGVKDGPTHAYYEAQWAAQSQGDSQASAAVKDRRRVIVSNVAGDFDNYTSYEVRVLFQGKQTTYRALVVSRQDEAEQPAAAQVKIFDNVTVDMNTVYGEQSPRIRSPWEKYVKTTMYQAVARTIKETRDAGKPLRPADAPIGYLPGDDVSPNDQDSRTLADPCAGLSVTMSSAQNIKDGSTASFNVTTSGGTPASYNWTFSVPSGSGNSPHVTFTNGNTDSVTTDGHWFANPNSECSAAYDSVYTIKCTVTFDNNKTKSAQTTLTVNAYWNPGGSTGVPAITGGVQTGFDTSRQLYVVINSGTAARGAPPVTIYVPSASQFYNKTVTHEDRHVYQFTTGMNVDLFTIADMMTHLGPLTDPTAAGLQTKINNEFLAWYNAQYQIAAGRINAAEKDAYDVSDPLAPKFLYQNCGRFH